MILIIDNYDSFTYNLVQLLHIAGATTHVIYNDELSLAQIKQLSFSHLLISPGPGSPDDAGVSLDLIDYYHTRCPILGVCLGHQCLAYYFDGKVVRAGQIMHGKCSIIEHNGEGIFRGIPNFFRATRYHSLVADPNTFPQELIVSAVDSGSPVIMGLSHQKYPLFGVQFHPEAILSQYGLEIINNFLKLD